MKKFLIIERMGVMKLAWMFAIITSFASCSQKRLSSSKSFEEITVYPSPPDTARIQYLTSFSSSQEIEKNRGVVQRYVLGEKPSRPILKPYGGAFGKDKIYICDLDFEGLEIMNLKTGEFEYFKPKGLGKFQLPINCSVDSAGWLFVADVKRKEILVFDENLKFVSSFSRPGTFKPTDVVVKGDTIWVCNILDATIDVFKKDSANTFLFSFPDVSASQKKMYQPTNLVVDDSKVYVSDFGEFNVKIFDHKGNLLSIIGSYGKGIGQFARPKGVAVDMDQNLFVVDAAFENVQVFDKDGNLLLFFGGSYYKNGGMWLPAKVAISYQHNDYFEKYVHESYKLNYIIMVTNNFGPDKVNIYGSISVK